MVARGRARLVTAPVEVVIGTTDLAEAARFLGVFGFEQRDGGSYDQATTASAYGLDAATDWIRLGQPGVDRGTVRLVETPHESPRPDVTAAGPLAVDLYTTDIDASLAAAQAAGIEPGYLGTLDLGALVMRQCELWAPDNWRLVLVEANVRRPTSLDDTDRRHSEVHSVLWTVPSIEAAAPVLAEHGLEQTHVFPIQHPELARIVGLPTPDTTLVMNLMVDEVQAPIRVELCEFPEHPVAAETDSVLRAGIHALAFGANDVPGQPMITVAGVRLET